ncbi:MAG: hypothetical protein JXA13_13735 [Anaerolineales bacterium]|nr:hypothetical protein [Anaerolineales bacterium]
MKTKLILGLTILLSLACSLPSQLFPQAEATEDVRQAAPEPVAQAAATPQGEFVLAPQIINIQMLDEQNGWALTADQLLRTWDGGARWYAIRLPGDPILGYSANMDFSKTGWGWLLTFKESTDPNANGILYQTRDNGQNWTSNPVPFNSGSLSFIDPQHAWAMAGLGVGAGSNAVAIFQTVDGGSTWKQVYTNDPTLANSSDSLPLGGLKAGLAAGSMQTAWISGTTYAPGQIYFFRSDDGGQTWASVEVPLPPGANQETMFAVYSAPIFMSLERAILPVRVYGEPSMLNIYTSQDGGYTWTPSLSPVPDGRQSDFFSASEGIVWDGMKFHLTTDSAQSWITVTPNIGFGENFALMDYVSRTTGWVVTGDADGNRSLYRTTDGGATWTVLTP